MRRKWARPATKCIKRTLPRALTHRARGPRRRAGRGLGARDDARLPLPWDHDDAKVLRLLHEHALLVDLPEVALSRARAAVVALRRKRFWEALARCCCARPCQVHFADVARRARPAEPAGGETCARAQGIVAGVETSPCPALGACPCASTSASSRWSRAPGSGSMTFSGARDIFAARPCHCSRASAHSRGRRDALALRRPRATPRRLPAFLLPRGRAQWCPCRPCARRRSIGTWCPGRERAPAHASGEAILRKVVWPPV